MANGIVLSVEDSGPGVKPNMSDVILIVFTLLETVALKEENASGLSLAVVNK